MAEADVNPNLPERPPVEHRSLYVDRRSHRKPMSKRLKVGLTLGAVVVLAAGTMIFIRQRTLAAPVDVTRQFLTDLQGGIEDDAFNLTSPTFRATTTKADFRVVVKNEKQYLPKMTPKITKKSLHKTGGVRTAEVTALIGQGSGGFTAVAKLSQQGGDWLIDNIEIKSNTAG